MKTEIENRFYNEDLKNKFLSDIRKNVSDATFVKYATLFNVSYNVEQSLDKDLSDFKEDEIISLFEKANWLNGNTAKSYKSAIKNYFTWCKNNLPNFSNDINFFQIKNDDISLDYFKENCLFISVNSVLEILDIIEKNLPKNKDWNMNIIALFYVDLMRNGVKISELPEIKKSDVDYTNNEINVNSRAIKMNKQLFEYLKYYNRNVITKDSEYLFRTQKAPQITENSIISKITRLNVYLNELGYSKKISERNMRISYLFRTLDKYSLEYCDITSFEIFSEVIEREGETEFIQQKYFDLYMRYKAQK